MRRPNTTSSTAAKRGWRNALRQRGVEPDPTWVEYGDISAQSGYEATRRLIARGGKFTALFAGNDTIAFGAIRALREAGLRIPEDVALVGYDDIPLAAFAIAAADDDALRPDQPWPGCDAVAVGPAQPRRPHPVAAA